MGDLDCSDRSLQTMNAILSYLRQNNTDRFIFLGDIDYRNKTDLRTSYSICGQHFLEQVPKYTELRMIRGNHENNTLWKNITDHFVLNDNIWYEKINDVPIGRYEFGETIPELLKAVSKCISFSKSNGKP